MSKYPNYLSPDGTTTKQAKSRARREPSGVFSLFQPAQIQQFKEAFQLIDVDKDGWVTENDLKEIYENLGIPGRKQRIEELLNARPGSQQRSQESSAERGINFTMFLTMMSERLIEFDGENELVDAFSSFDDDDSGTVNVAEMRKWLSEMGDRMDENEMDQFLTETFTDKKGNFNYKEWVKVIRIKEEE